MLTLFKCSSKLTAKNGKGTCTYMTNVSNDRVQSQTLIKNIKF